MFSEAKAAGVLPGSVQDGDV